MGKLSVALSMPGKAATWVGKKLDSDTARKVLGGFVTLLALSIITALVLYCVQNFGDSPNGWAGVIIGCSPLEAMILVPMLMFGIRLMRYTSPTNPTKDKDHSEL